MANEGSQQVIKGAITISGGSGVLTLTNIWLNARWIRIKPVAETDTYTVVGADAEGIIMFSRTSQLGTLSEKLEMSLGVLRTITVSSAAQDGTYQVRFDPH